MSQRVVLDLSIEEARYVLTGLASAVFWTQKALKDGVLDSAFTERTKHHLQELLKLEARIKDTPAIEIDEPRPR